MSKAVKDGRLGRKPKSGMKPEVFYHPDFEYLANEARACHATKMAMAMQAACRATMV
jgi:hypothetical protein